jgi:hypothetical protein
VQQYVLPNLRDLMYKCIPSLCRMSSSYSTLTLRLPLPMQSSLQSSSSALIPSPLPPHSPNSHINNPLLSRPHTTDAPLPICPNPPHHHKLLSPLPVALPLFSLLFAPEIPVAISPGVLKNKLGPCPSLTCQLKYPRCFGSR